MNKRFAAFALCLLVLVSFTMAQQSFITIATGGTAGTYFPLGGAMAEIWNKSIKNMNATTMSTAASAANVALLKGNKVDVIFVQNDAAYYALNDLEIYTGKGYSDIRGMAALYNETCQLVALAETGIKNVGDLKGKRVSVGAAGSGVELNARQILAAAGLTYDDIKVQYLSFGESASNLKDGNIDAAFQTAGHPTAAVQDIAANKAIRIIPIDDTIATKLQAKYPFYTKTTVEAGTYKGVDKDTQTVAVKAMLAVSAKLDPEFSEKFLRFIIDEVIRHHQVAATR